LCKNQVLTYFDTVGLNIVSCGLILGTPSARAVDAAGAAAQVYVLPVVF
jgi:hypothetical protein